MLDILLFRDEKGGNTDLVRESQRRRGGDEAVALVDEVIELDKTWRAARGELDAANAEINQIGAEIKKIMRETKDKNSIAPQLERKADVEKRVAELKLKVKEHKKILNQKLWTVGNLVHDSVPVSQTEDDNLEIRKWGECKPLQEGHLNHHELLWKIDGYEPERGVNIAGHRHYFLKGWGVRLQMALVNYGMNFLVQRGYQPLTVPLMMKQSIMAETANWLNSMKNFIKSLVMVKRTNI